MEHFVAGTTARAAAELVGVNRNTAVSFYNRLRMIIAAELTKGSPVSGEIEVDESYFVGRRKGKRGRGAAGKVPVFGVLKRGGKVYTTPIPNAKSVTLLPIIQQMIVPDSIVYTDHLPSYNALDVSSFLMSALIIQRLLCKAPTISMASKILGTRPNGIYVASMGSATKPFHFISKNVSGVLMGAAINNC